MSTKCFQESWRNGPKLTKSVFRTYIRGHKHPNLQLRCPILFVPLGTHTHACTYRHTNTHLKNFKSFKKMLPNCWMWQYVSVTLAVGGRSQKNTGSLGPFYIGNSSPSRNMVRPCVKNKQTKQEQASKQTRNRQVFKKKNNLSQYILFYKNDLKQLSIPRFICV